MKKINWLSFIMFLFIAYATIVLTSAIEDLLYLGCENGIFCTVVECILK